MMSNTVRRAAFTKLSVGACSRTALWPQLALSVPQAAVHDFARPRASEWTVVPPSERKSWHESPGFTFALAALVGGLFTIAGGFLATNDAERRRASAEKRRHDGVADNMQLHLTRAQRLILCARAAFLRRGYVEASSLLRAAEDNVIKADTLLTAIPVERRASELARLGFSQDAILHLNAHVAYHRGALHLRELDINAALSDFAVSYAARVAGTPSSRINSEMQRVNIKIADANSQRRNLGAALSTYERLVGDPTIVGTFWRVRALNNAAVVKFALGRDVTAQALMAQARREADTWLDTALGEDHPMSSCQDVDARRAELDALADEVRAWRAAAFDGPSPPQRVARPPSTHLLRLIAAGADVVVDVVYVSNTPRATQRCYRDWTDAAWGDGLAVPWTDEASDATVDSTHAFAVAPREFAAHHFSAQADVLFAAECLERVRLLLRKQCTARVNQIVMCTSPYAFTMDTSGYRLRADAIVPLVDLLESLAAAPRGAAVYKVLDHDWAAHEGSLRVLAGMSAGLVELLAADAIPASSRVACRALLGNVTRELHDRARDRTATSGIHAAVARTVRARFLDVTGDRTGALDTLDALYDDWVRPEQDRARRLDAERRSGGHTWPHAAVPPRHARRQMCIMLRRLELSSRAGRWGAAILAPATGADDLALLEFAMRDLADDSHPLVLARTRLAGGTVCGRPIEERLDAPHAELDRCVNGLIDSLQRMWQAWPSASASRAP